MNNWKIAFFVSLAILVIVSSASGYILLINTLASGHCRDNLQIIAEDVSNISSAIKSDAKTIDDFEKALDKIDASYSSEEATIRLQIVVIVFDNKGHFETIQF